MNITKYVIRPYSISTLYIFVTPDNVFPLNRLGLNNDCLVQAMTNK